MNPKSSLNSQNPSFDKRLFALVYIFSLALLAGQWMKRSYGRVIFDLMSGTQVVIAKHKSIL